MTGPCIDFLKAKVTIAPSWASPWCLIPKSDHGLLPQSRELRAVSHCRKASTDP